MEHDGSYFHQFPLHTKTGIQGFMEIGFKIEEIIEPPISKEQLARYPELEDQSRAPNFIIYSLSKP